MKEHTRTHTPEIANFCLSILIQNLVLTSKAYKCYNNYIGSKNATKAHSELDRTWFILIIIQLNVVSPLTQVVIETPWKFRNFMVDGSFHLPLPLSMSLSARNHSTAKDSHVSCSSFSDTVLLPMMMMEVGALNETNPFYSDMCQCNLIEQLLLGFFKHYFSISYCR